MLASESTSIVRDGIRYKNGEIEIHGMSDTHPSLVQQLDSFARSWYYHNMDSHFRNASEISVPKCWLQKIVVP